MFGQKGIAGQTSSLNERSLGSVPKTVEFDVTPSAGKMALAVGFFGVCALYSFYKVVYPRPLLINGLIELGLFGAQLFFGTLLFASLGFVARGGYGFIRSFGDSVFLTLDSHSISGPTFYGGAKTERVNFASIHDIKFTQMKDQEFVVIEANDGRKIRVGAANFRVESEWPQFLDEFRARIGSSGSR